MTNQSLKKSIYIKGARIHNLKNIDVEIPRNKMVVITGLSGSGKSSLAFDTLYAEGQRRYVESLSSYARQFLGKLNKPKVDFIKGIAPAIAIEQKVNTTNPRSTVGSSTEIYDYLKLLFARIGKTIDPKSGEIVKKDTVSDVVDYVKEFTTQSKYMLLAPIVPLEHRTKTEQIKILQQQGYSRLYVDGSIQLIGDQLNGDKSKEMYLVVDRLVHKTEDQDYLNRLGDAVELTFFEGKGHCSIYQIKENKWATFNNKYEHNGEVFVEPNVHFFSFNNPFGACPNCEGYGSVIGIDEDLVVPNTSLSIYDNALAPWRGERTGFYKNELVKNAHKIEFPIHKPYFELNESQKDMIWNGSKYFSGINQFFKELEEKSYKIQNRVMLSRYRGKTKCPNCNGKRLRDEASFVKINQKAITELVDLPIDELVVFFNQITLSDYETKVAKRLLIEIKNRLNYLIHVGLGYLTINRRSNTLSGGESQRINLATSLGSSLVGSMYILDEPSIGLHSQDTQKLIQVLKQLKDLGNTVIIVEHDEEIMQAADELIDIGPEAGFRGGEVVAQGNYTTFLKGKSLTAQYLNGQMKIQVPPKRRIPTEFINIIGARENNLKNIDVQFPLNAFTVVTGVSGSGKTTLVKDILYPALQRKLFDYGNKPGQHSELKGDYNKIKQIEFVDQNPIGRSSRSNPITYIKAFDTIRHLFASEKLSKLRGYKTQHFSFNVEGGRCENCKGDGTVTIEMQFMADVHLTCDVCQGKRYQKEILEVQFHDHSISDVLDLTVDEAIAFFDKHQEKKIKDSLSSLQEVGLGYVTLGQRSSTLSGGEAQRIKLASFLGKGKKVDTTLFIFDEPTTGLHFHDIKKLLASFNALLSRGHTVLVIEHNLDLIKCADYLIDLGPQGGKKGGQLVCAGTPEEVVLNKKSITAKFLKDKL